MRPTIGVVGYGDFTKVICRFLEPYADIVVSSRQFQTGEAVFGARFASLDEVLGCSLIIPSFPSQHFRDFFSTNVAKINPQATVIDVCSVKVQPLAALEELLPETCQIIGTHPMFGPASIEHNGGIRGLKCALVPVRCEEASLAKLIDFLSNTLELYVINKTAEEHDREMAYVQGLSHYIGRVLEMMEIPDSELATVAYEHLLEMKRVQGTDSWDLFMSIACDNPYTQEVHQRFLEAEAQLGSKVFC